MIITPKKPNLRLLIFIPIGLLLLLSLRSVALNHATPMVLPGDGWTALEIVTHGDDPPGDGIDYTVSHRFDGIGAWIPEPGTLRLLLNHETEPASVSEIEIDPVVLRQAVQRRLVSRPVENLRFVRAARPAYTRWSSDGGKSWRTPAYGNFRLFCSGQLHPPDSFGTDRGFADPVYLFGEEFSGGRLFALDTTTRDLYQVSGETGGPSAAGTPGMPFDAWENAALIDTGETRHIALLLSADGGSHSLQLYLGEKGKDPEGKPSNAFLARNGLAWGSWYYLKGSLPTESGITNRGHFDRSAAGALAAPKMEDIDTSPGQPTRVALGNQRNGVFVLDFDLHFANDFNAAASGFRVTRIAGAIGGQLQIDNPDNVDWIAPTSLDGIDYPEGLILVNEDNPSGEIWMLEPNGDNPKRIGQTRINGESTGILDLSQLLGYRPGNLLLVNNQGSPSSMSLLIHPDAAEAR